MGYTWEGMMAITKAEAIERFINNKEVYRLYEDGTEGLIEDIAEFENPYFNDYDYGYEL